MNNQKEMTKKQMVHCLICDHIYLEPEINLEECPNCFNADMTQTVYLQRSENN